MPNLALRSVPGDTDVSGSTHNAGSEADITPDIAGEMTRGRRASVLSIEWCHLALEATISCVVMHTTDLS